MYLLIVSTKSSHLILQNQAKLFYFVPLWVQEHSEKGLGVYQFQWKCWHLCWRCYLAHFGSCFCRWPQTMLFSRAELAWWWCLESAWDSQDGGKSTHTKSVAVRLLNHLLFIQHMCRSSFVLTKYPPHSSPHPPTIPKQGVPLSQSMDTRRN